MITHPIEPVYDSKSKILILGSFPSVKSREYGFFYGHPQNRFWSVIAALCNAAVPQSINEKKELLLNHGIALWDVIYSCEILGSADSTIRNPVPTDLSKIIKTGNIQLIATNGKMADKLYNRFQLRSTNITPVCLPSTSPANAAWLLERLTEEWSSVIKPFL